MELLSNKCITSNRLKTVSESVDSIGTLNRQIVYKYSNGTLMQ